MVLIDGKKVAAEVLGDIARQVNKLKESGGKVPHLAAILVGNDIASETYVSQKVKACGKAGFKSTLIRFPVEISESELLSKVEDLNREKDIDGFIVQLPLPAHISESKVIEAIDPGKDVDGFHPLNIGRMMLGLPGFLPATPFGILKLIEYYNIETMGKHCVVVGRSHIVGLPVSILLGRNTYPGNCTVTLAHSKTRNLEELIRSADLLIAATGKTEFVTSAMVKDGAAVIDVGISRLPSADSASGYRLAGDVRFSEVAPRCSYITPVPGGVGPMTIVSLMLNTLKAGRKEFN